MTTVPQTATATDAGRQAFNILRFGFTVAPIIAGADKFFHLLADWDKYLAPWVINIVHNGQTSLWRLSRRCVARGHHHQSRDLSRLF